MSDDTLKPEITGTMAGLPRFAKCPLCRKTFSLVPDGKANETLDKLFRQHVLEKHFAKDVSRK